LIWSDVSGGLLQLVDAESGSGKAWKVPIDLASKVRHVLAVRGGRTPAFRIGTPRVTSRQYGQMSN